MSSKSGGPIDFVVVAGKALDAVLAGGGLDKAAKAAGVHKSTIYHMQTGHEAHAVEHPTENLTECDECRRVAKYRLFASMWRDAEAKYDMGLLARIRASAERDNAALAAEVRAEEVAEALLRE